MRARQGRGDLEAGRAGAEALLGGSTRPRPLPRAWGLPTTEAPTGAGHRQANLQVRAAGLEMLEMRVEVGGIFSCVHSRLSHGGPPPGTTCQRPRPGATAGTGASSKVFPGCLQGQDLPQAAPSSLTGGGGHSLLPRWSSPALPCPSHSSTAMGLGTPGTQRGQDSSQFMAAETNHHPELEAGTAFHVVPKGTTLLLCPYFRAVCSI